MEVHLRGALLAFILVVFGLSVPCYAAPDRLDDTVPDATPDQEGSFSFSYGIINLDTDGPLVTETTVHQFYKLRYTFSDDVAVTFRLDEHDLTGNLGLLSPLLDSHDNGQSFGFDLDLNLLTVPRTEADPDNNVAFAAGSSFGVGIGGTQFTLDAGSLSRDETLMKAYLVYSTDLTEEMRAHTYFSTGRLSGDVATGSTNRVGAGLDYDLVKGKHPLTLMANGTLDIYNFREPAFNTGRISRFDLGLRYRVMRNWYASLGWVTANDSENDASGSGIFAGFNFVNEPPDCEECIECEEEPVAAEEQPQPAAPAASAGNPSADMLMAVATPDPQSLSLFPEDEASPAVGKATSSVANFDQFDMNEIPGSDLQAGQGQAPDGLGILIPEFPEQPPVHTMPGDVFVRAGRQVKEIVSKHHTSPGDVLLRPLAQGKGKDVISKANPEDGATSQS